MSTGAPPALRERKEMDVYCNKQNEEMGGQRKYMRRWKARPAI